MSEKVEEKKKEFHSQMTVEEVMLFHPEASLVLTSYHLGGCSHCAIREYETLEQVCMGYGIPLEQLLGSLNNLLED